MSCFWDTVLWLGGFHLSVAVVVGVFFFWIDSLDVAESEWSWKEACWQAMVVGLLWPLPAAFLVWNWLWGE